MVGATFSRPGSGRYTGYLPDSELLRVGGVLILPAASKVHRGMRESSFAMGNTRRVLAVLAFVLSSLGSSRRAAPSRDGTPSHGWGKRDDAPQTGDFLRRTSAAGVHVYLDGGEVSHRTAPPGQASYAGELIDLSAPGMRLPPGNQSTAPSPSPLTGRGPTSR